MKITAISDLHGKMIDLEGYECDVLLIAGDICPAYDHSISFQRMWLQQDFIKWLEKNQKYCKNIVFVAGNHDFFFEDIYQNEQIKEFKYLLPENCFYLMDEEIIIDGKKIYGTPWQPEFCNWAFNRTEEGLYKKFEHMPSNIDILLSHGPARGHCDTIMEYKENNLLGSASLQDRIVKVKPNYVITGHIHSGNHNWENQIVNGNREINYACVSILDERYKKAYKPLQFEI